MKIPFVLLGELLQLCVLLCISTEGKRIYEEDPDFDAILNDLRPFAVLRFSDPREFLRLLREDPNQLKYAAERPARVQKLIRELEEFIHPTRLQLPPGGGSMWLGLSQDSEDYIFGLEDR